MRTSNTITIENPAVVKQQLLAWAQSHREIVFLDSNNYPQQYSSFNCLLAVDAFTSIKSDSYAGFDELKNYQQASRDWVLGYLSYDMKNGLEHLKSENYDGLQFPDLYFFQPKKLFLLKGNSLELQYLRMCDDEMDEDLQAIFDTPQFESLSADSLNIQQRISKESYLEKAQKMLSHIHRGDIYEANFCMEFYAENARIQPLEIYNKLNAISEPPFASFFKMNHQYLLSASPERYLRKEGETLISQPIKGTSKRFSDPVLDEKSKTDLEANEKERSENIMIVDLVRNDLSRTAQKGTVNVEELCGTYSFKQVHHLISTITSKLKPEFSAIDVVKTTFPMGSMTGAPKISAMNIIEDLEETKRGLYSGAVGYFTPESDFDFNVVIRSILYNEENNYVSFSVGSAITAQANPEKEYEECLLKAKAMREVLEAR